MIEYPYFIYLTYLLPLLILDVLRRDDSSFEIVLFHERRNLTPLIFIFLMEAIKSYFDGYLCNIFIINMSQK